MNTPEIQPVHQNFFRRDLHGWLLGGVLLVAALCRVGYAFSDGLVPRDGMMYLSKAEQWRTSGDFRTLKVISTYSGDAAAPESYTAPCYLFILKTMKTVFPSVPMKILAVWWGIGIGTAFVALVYWIARLLFASPGTALAVAFLAAVHPRCAESAPLVLRDTTFLFLQTLVLALAVTAWLRRRWPVMGLAGFFVPLVFLCRFEGLAQALFLMGVLSLCMLVRRERFHALLLIAFIIGIVAGVFFWTWLMSLPLEFYRVYFSRYIYLRYVAS